ncbi:UTP--glucose-1-phosphate uridylyltransferase GalU [Paenibacillus thermoaerophilus]|uniref:UTP--glucose-1-phosphate uridylyltransferase n=1 Tax=Paenibacillus thermoaerophilus TaxID=1215385 RepID=A0ABW2V462_9BACL|nr:UTP--glucose-1-phosphate uridylyltransferase GalU [Paenibacillus thermoaerophilus]TMV16149.1 UTP--glucose-1-phosphate uridylyltransferase GalU [Paenibacillus thermoaerophilus]
MKTVRKAVIPAAGLGTRFLPATKAMPKEMLPIVDKPTIQYIVEEAVQSGIEDIIIVTGRSKGAIEDHFDKNFELECNLLEKQKMDLYEMVEDITRMVEIHYIRQKEALGLGHAVWCARKFIGSEPFAVLLGDMIIDSPVPCLKQMMDVYGERQSSLISVEQVPWEDVHQYGVIRSDPITDRLSLIESLVEKPKHNPPSNLAIVGRYILEPEILDILETLEPGIGGEIQLTDALRELARRQAVYGYRYEGTLYDVGSKLGFLKATVEFALRREEIRGGFHSYLRDLQESPLFERMTVRG